MPTYHQATEELTSIAAEVITRHPALVEHGVKVDYLKVYPDYDDVSGEAINDALKQYGKKALGICRKLGPKDRAMGRGDAEILIDGHWWDGADEGERIALLDHELYHLVPTGDVDDKGRPKLKIRPHDYQVGWFVEVAKRNGRYSLERQQAHTMMQLGGQYLWPEIWNAAKGTGRFESLETVKVQAVG